MTTPLFPSVIAWNVLDGGTDAQDGNNYPGPALQEYAAAVVGAAVRKQPAGMTRNFATFPIPPLDFSSGGLARTYDVQFAAKRKFFGARLLLSNLNASAVANYTAVRVGASPKHLTALGTEVSWWPDLVPVAGSTSFAIPAAKAGDAANHVKPAFVMTDFVPVTPVARTDVPNGKFLLRARVRGAAEAQFPHSVSSGYAPSWNAYVGTEGRVIGSFLTSTDYVTSAPTDTAYVLAETGGAIQPIAAVFSYETPGRSIWAFGDSMFQGVGSSVGQSTNFGVLGWPTLIDLQNDLIDTVNMGLSGQTTVDSVATFDAMIAAADERPSYVAFKVYSPNDGSPTQARIDKSWGLMLYAITKARNLGINVLVFTSPPVNTWTAAQHAFVEAQNARALALDIPGVGVIDMATTVSNPANRRTLSPAYDFGDSTHINDAGHQAVADVVLQKITP